MQRKESNGNKILNFEVNPLISNQLIVSFLEFSLSSFIQGRLHLYKDDFSDITTIEEDFFNQELLVYLAEEFPDWQKLNNVTVSWIFINQCANPTEYTQKTQKGIRPRVDIGVQIARAKNIFFTIEGKRLVKPNDPQYVSGKTGGINRYKLEKHGKFCNQSAIVGYMQAENFDFWHTKINTWIESEVSKTNQEVVWSASDKLQKRNNINPILSKCGSSHKRKTLADIALTHYWINLQ